MADTTTPSVLIVDDEEIIRDFLAQVLEEYDLAMAEDGDIAIDLLKGRAFDLIITDLRMPRVSGEQVVKFAKETHPDAKVIVISGYSSLFTVSQSAAFGASTFLSKPFSIKQLLDAVESAIGGAN